MRHPGLSTPSIYKRRMQLIPLRRTITSFSALLALPGIAEAHPGHIPLDWFCAPPHCGHAEGYATALLTMGIVAMFWGACCLASRKGDPNQ